MTLWKIFLPKEQSLLPMPIHRINPKLYAKRVFLKIQYFKNILKVCELQGREKRTYAYMHCTCEQILDYTNNPANVFALIFYSFAGSLWNFRFCQIRPIYPILLFWSKWKNACKNAKLAQKHHNIKRWGFFFNTLYLY